MTVFFCIFYNLSTLILWMDFPITSSATTKLLNSSQSLFLFHFKPLTLFSSFKHFRFFFCAYFNIFWLFKTFCNVNYLEMNTQIAAHAIAQC